MRGALAVLILAGAAPLLAAGPPDPKALRHSVEQLRASIGKWDVVTDFLGPDGAVAKSVAGTYEFEWVVPDRVVRGRSDLPELERSAGILFYIRESTAEIEMISVGGDGRLWIMTGPLGGETRMTQEYDAQGGGKGRLRFTRYNVKPDSFESRMEWTEDGGKTWKPGNHQLFRRATPPG